MGHANISTMQRCMRLEDRELVEAQDLVDWNGWHSPEPLWDIC